MNKFSSLVREAKAFTPSVVVLDIESPGGSVAVMHTLGEIVQREFAKSGGGPRVVAWPGMAGSAAAYLTLTCPTIVAKPAARVGASLKIVNAAKGWVALDDLPQEQGGYAKKIQSFADAAERSALQFGGHAVPIWEAMSHVKSELWWSPRTREFSGTRPADAREAVQLDGPGSVLTLTGAELIRYGVAGGEASDLASLLRALAMPGDAKVVQVGDRLPEWFSQVKDAVRECVVRIDSVDAQLSAFKQALSDITSTKSALEKARVKRKSFADKDRGRDEALAAERALNDRLAKLSRDAGRAATQLKTMVEAIERANGKLEALGAEELQTVPLAWHGAVQLKAALACYRSDDPRGALAAIAAMQGSAK
ncbi:MAG: hypothetical protein U0625_12635 [Phycisphaerales bacterium]